ncbi:RNA polymerase sigma factor [Streptomyces sp. NPDC001073]
MATDEKSTGALPASAGRAPAQPAFGSSGCEERLSAFTEHRPYLWRFLRTQLPFESIGPVLNDVAARYVTLRNPPDPSHVKAYLKGMARNAVADHWRQAAYRQRTEVLVGGQAELDPLQCRNPLLGLERSAEEVVADVLMHEELRRKITSLAPQMRKVIELIYLKGMTSREAARAMGIPDQSARTYRARGLQRLRELYDADPRLSALATGDET